MKTILTDEIRANLRISYGLRRVPQEKMAKLLQASSAPQSGDVALARLERIGRNAGLELPDGRRCSLHEGDYLAVVFGNRYATMQFEGYARTNGDRCDLLSMGGLCGLVESKHVKAADPTQLRLLGFIADSDGRPLNLCEFALPPLASRHHPRVTVVCGTSMDAGKTYTAVSLIKGLRRHGHRVAGIKLTGTATGKDRWNMLDAGACTALDFVDGGYPSTYLCHIEDLIELHRLLLAHAAAANASCAVIEIADGLLQKETAALLADRRFTSSVDEWVLAAGDPMGALSAVSLMRERGIQPAAVSGMVSMSALGRRESFEATKLPCLTASELEAGEWQSSTSSLLALHPATSQMGPILFSDVKEMTASEVVGN